MIERSKTISNKHIYYELLIGCIVIHHVVDERYILYVIDFFLDFKDILYLDLGCTNHLEYTVILCCLFIGEKYCPLEHLFHCALILFMGCLMYFNETSDYTKEL